jgi:hypothetical protein
LRANAAVQPPSMYPINRLRKQAGSYTFAHAEISEVASCRFALAEHCRGCLSTVGAGLLAKAAVQPSSMYPIKRLRQQAGSCRFAHAEISEVASCRFANV